MIMATVVYPDCPCCGIRCPANPGHLIPRSLYVRFKVCGLYTPLPNAIWVPGDNSWEWNAVDDQHFVAVNGCSTSQIFDPGAYNAINFSDLVCGGAPGAWGDLGHVGVEDSFANQQDLFSNAFTVQVDPYFLLIYDLGVAAEFGLNCCDDITSHMFLEFSARPF